MKVNRLNQVEFFRLCQGVETNAHVIREQKLSREEAKTLLELKLKMALTKANVDSACRVLDIVFWAKQPKIKSNVKILAKAIGDLYARLGEPVPDNLKELQ